MVPCASILWYLLSANNWWPLGLVYLGLLAPQLLIGVQSYLTSSTAVLTYASRYVREVLLVQDDMECSLQCQFVCQQLCAMLAVMALSDEVGR